MPLIEQRDPVWQERRRTLRASRTPIVLAAAAVVVACHDAPVGVTPESLAETRPQYSMSASASGPLMTWYTLRTDGGADVAIVGHEGDIPVPADYDGDGKADRAVFHPETGVWSLLRSGWQDLYEVPFGQMGDRPVPGDYDADGLADLAVFRPGTGVWWIYRSGSGSTINVPFGLGTDIPAAADYDGDGRTDIAVFRPSSATWWILRSTGGMDVIPFGLASDVIVPADYDGDGRADLAVFRPSSGQWWIRSSSSGAVSLRSWGLSTDVPVPGDYDGDGAADAAVFRPSTGQWWVLQTSDGSPVVTTFGLGSDTPVPARYAGGSRDRIATIRLGLQPQTIVFTSTAPAEAAIGSTYEVRATGGGSARPVTYSSLTPLTCIAVDSTVTFVGVGLCTIAADQEGDRTYEAAPQATQSVAVVYPFTYGKHTVPPPALNLVTAGSTVMVSFGLGEDRGLGIFDPASPRSGEVSCASPELPPSTTSATNSSGPALKYSRGTGLYTYAWKTDRAWRGTCRWFILDLADGSTRTAVYRFR